MKAIEIYDVLDELDIDTEIYARFDFPLHGKTEKFKIKKVLEDGTIILDNPYAQKPLGHE